MRVNQTKERRSYLSGFVICKTHENPNDYVLEIPLTKDLQWSGYGKNSHVYKTLKQAQAVVKKNDIKDCYIRAMEYISDSKQNLPYFSEENDKTYYVYGNPKETYGLSNGKKINMNEATFLGIKF
jgi:hypothetical protein